MKKLNREYLFNHTKLRATARILVYLTIMIISVEFVEKFTITDIDNQYMTEAYPFLFLMLGSFMELYRYIANYFARVIPKAFVIEDNA